MKILGILAYVFGGLVFFTAKSSIHETVALLIILNGTIFISASFIVDALKPEVSAK